MDTYDKILKFYNRKDRIAIDENYLEDFINKYSKNLSEMQFTNCIILILPIMNGRNKNCFLMEGKLPIDLQINEKLIMLDILKKEFIYY